MSELSPEQAPKETPEHKCLCKPVDITLVILGAICVLVSFFGNGYLMITSNIETVMLIIGMILLACHFFIDELHWNQHE